MWKLFSLFGVILISLVAMGAYQGTCFGGVDPVEECELACGIGCPAPQYWVCGVNGQKYCNSCLADCHGGVDPTGEACLTPCADLGGQCLSDPMDVTFPANCNADYAMADLEGKCPASNRTCCTKWCNTIKDCLESYICIDYPDDGCSPETTSCPRYCVAGQM